MIFGAWLMQKADLHEKQVVLLTRENCELEQALELKTGGHFVKKQSDIRCSGEE